MLTARIAEALALSVEAHNGQTRKGTTIPYVAHPMAVASIALEHGADEDLAMAALLHDAVEDGGALYEQRIREKFGERVADVVLGCTDGVPDSSGLKAPWKTRKMAYLKHLMLASDDVLLVSSSDKLHNARSIVGDLLNIGNKVFEKFSVSKDETIWYYESLTQIFESRGTKTARALRATVEEMKHLAA